MSRDLLTVEAGVPIVAAVQQMAERNVGAVLVTEAGRLAGIMTERDLMRAFARGLRDDAVVGECMTANPETIAPDDTIGARRRPDDPRRLPPSTRSRW